jgi:hypothetical protein
MATQQVGHGFGEFDKTREISDYRHYSSPWIAMNAAHVRTDAAISTRNGFTVDFAISLNRVVQTAVCGVFLYEAVTLL